MADPTGTGAGAAAVLDPRSAEDGTAAAPTHARFRRGRGAATTAAIAAVAAWLLLASGGPARPAIPSGVDPGPPQATTFVTGNDAETRASRFLLSLPQEKAVDYAIVLDLLRRRFGLDWAAPLVAFARWASARPGGETASLFARVYDPGAHAPSPPWELARNKTDRLTSTALHCDIYPVPDGYSADIERSLSSRSLSDRTHATIALLWADEHGCLDPSGAARLRQTAADILEQSVRQEPSVHDQFVEAVALLYELGERDRIDESWIDAIRGAQQRDGGWAEDASSGESSGHTTALALWVLLEDSRPDRASTTWIRDP